MVNILYLICFYDIYIILVDLPLHLKLKML